MGVPHAGMPYQWGTIPRGGRERATGIMYTHYIYIYTNFRGMVAVLFFFSVIFLGQKS